MITCRELAEFLMDYVSGTLSADEKRIFEEHLQVCPACVAYLKSYEETVRLGKAAFARADAEAPADVPQELVRAILAARQRGK